MAGRNRSSNEGATGTDAPCLDPDDDERLWTGHVVVEKRGEQQGRRDGAQAAGGERLRKLLKDLVAGFEPRPLGYEPT